MSHVRDLAHHLDEWRDLVGSESGYVGQKYLERPGTVANQRWRWRAIRVGARTRMGVRNLGGAAASARNAGSRQARHELCDIAVFLRAVVVHDGMCTAAWSSERHADRRSISCSNVTVLIVNAAMPVEGGIVGYRRRLHVRGWTRHHQGCMQARHDTIRGACQEATCERPEAL